MQQFYRTCYVSASLVTKPSLGPVFDEAGKA